VDVAEAERLIRSRKLTEPMIVRRDRVPTHHCTLHPVPGSNNQPIGRGVFLD
jgi:hypothetical protein